MRILHTDEMGVKGGQSIRVLEDLKIIRELGHEPLLACKGSNWIAREADKLDIEVIDLAFKSRADIKTAKEIFKLIKDRHIDIVHTHSSIDSYLATYCAKLLGRSVVRSRHSELSKTPGHIYRIVDAIITTGERVAKQLRSAGVRRPEILSIPSYPDERYFIPSNLRAQEAKRRFKTDASLCTLGAMTGTNPQKGVEFLLDTFALIHKKYPGVKLLIAGEKEPKLFLNLNEKLKRLKIAHAVDFVGYVEPRLFLEAIDIYICPSYKEGIPQSLMQAMMMAKACLASDVGSICDLNIENNLPLFPKKDSDALSKILKDLISNPNMRYRLGEKNRLLAQKHFSRSVMKERTAKLYEKLGAKNA